MLWLFAAGGLAGLLLGLRFRVTALIAASGMTAVVGMTAATHMGLEFLAAVGVTFALLGVLQVAYVLGLMLSCARSRAKFLVADRYILADGREPGHFKAWARPGNSRER